MRVNRSHGQHVVVVPGWAYDDGYAVPIRLPWPSRISCGVLLGALAGTADVSCGRHHYDVLDINGVGQRGAKRTVIQPTIGGQACDRGHVDHGRAHIRGRSHCLRKGVHVAEPGSGWIVCRPEFVAGLANAHDSGVGCDTAERGSPGIRLCTNNSRHYRAVPVAIGRCRHRCARSRRQERDGEGGDGVPRRCR